MIKINAFKALVGSSDFKLIGVVISYLLAAALGIWLLFGDIGKYPIWPPAGVALALMILLGHRIWPAILIGSLLTYTLVFTTQGIHIDINAIIAIVGISIGSLVESLVGYKLYRMFIDDDSTPHQKISNTFIFIVLTAFISLIGSLSFTIGIHSFLPVQNNLLPSTFITNYLSELTGVWLFANLILSWAKSKTHYKLSWWNTLESILYISAIGTLLFVINQQDLSIPLQRSFPFLIIPFLLWVAFRSSIQMATFIVLVDRKSVV